MYEIIIHHDGGNKGHRYCEKMHFLDESVLDDLWHRSVCGLQEMKCNSTAIVLDCEMIKGFAGGICLKCYNKLLKFIDAIEARGNDGDK